MKTLRWIAAAVFTGSMLLAGCGAGAGPSQGKVIAEPLTALDSQASTPTRFSWVIVNQLAGMAHPSTGEGLTWNTDYLSKQGVKMLVSLTETPVDASILSAYGVALLHLPVKDFKAPTIEQLGDFVSQASAAIGDGGGVTVHCAGGLGRTGTFLAAYLVANQGLSPDEAIAKVRDLRPGSIETQEQEQIVHDYAASLVAAGGDGAPESETVPE